MYYKILKQNSEIYKELKAFREKEILIEKKNQETIEKTIPHKWSKYLGYQGQQNFERVTTYSGFKFDDPEQVDSKIWRRHKENNDCFVPNLRTKAGREMRDFLNNLDKSSFFKLRSILGFQSCGRFIFPYLEICGDVLILFLDDRWIPKNEIYIEITSKEFEELRKTPN